MQKVVVQLRTEAYPAEDDDLAHLSPARFEHRSRLGKYPFAEQEDLLRNGLRPLRQPTQAAAPTGAIAEGHFSPRYNENPNQNPLSAFGGWLLPVRDASASN